MKLKTRHLALAILPLMASAAWSNDTPAQAATEPEFYTSVNAILFDPSRMMRWVMLPIDVRPWDLLATALSPTTWAKWINAPLDPRTQELFNRAADPETAQRWLDALGDPRNTPWFNPPTPTEGAQPAALPNPYAQPVPAKSTL